MNEIFASAMLTVVLLTLLSGGVWVGLTLAGVAWFGLEFFTARQAGEAMAMTIFPERVPKTSSPACESTVEDGKCGMSE